MMVENEHAQGVVLVVDDDEWSVFSARRLLEGLGYEVQEAKDGPAALGMVERAARAFTFVLLDLRMPGMDGVQVVRRLRAGGSDVGVILCTGYARSQVDSSVFSLGRVLFLQKPFGVDDLREQISSLHGLRTRG
jgi:CheY-like chemotaxis protein